MVGQHTFLLYDYSLVLLVLILVIINQRCLFGSQRSGFVPGIIVDLAVLGQNQRRPVGR